MAELCSHQINAVELVSRFDAASGRRLRRFVSLPGGTRGIRPRLRHVRVSGRSQACSSIESNAFDNYYEMYQGTKGTLILSHESDAMFFDEEASKRATAIAVSPRDGGAVAQSSETMAGNRNTSTVAASTSATGSSGPRPIRIEIQRFVRRFEPESLWPGSRQGHRVRSPLHPGQRSDQTEDASLV